MSVTDERDLFDALPRSVAEEDISRIPYIEADTWHLQSRINDQSRPTLMNQRTAQASTMLRQGQLLSLLHPHRFEQADYDIK